MTFIDYSWLTPAGVTSIEVECWGSGGGGRIGSFFDANNIFRGCGGGGGAYSRKANMAVTPGQTYTVRVGNGGGSNAGGDASLISIPSPVASLIEAKGGGPGTAVPSPGIGGSAAAGTGDVKFSGGDGGTYPGNGSAPGTGGGSSAGSAAAGANGGASAGGVAPFRGGSGGSGQSPNNPGLPGTAPGGGGAGGSGPTFSTNPAGGAGANGAVVIWRNGKYALGGAPLASFGSPPANPPQIKARKTSFFIS